MIDAVAMNVTREMKFATVDLSASGTGVFSVVFRPLSSWFVVAFAADLLVFVGAYTQVLHLEDHIL